MPSLSKTAPVVVPEKNPTRGTTSQAPASLSPMQAQLRANWYAGLMILAGALPLVTSFFLDLWNTRDHYSFCVLYVVCLGFLFRSRLPKSWPETQPLRRLEFCVMAGGLTLLLLASLLFSPWLGMIATLILTAGVLLQAGGRATVRRWLPVWIISWLLVPPPFGWDLEFVQMLRRRTANASASILDRLGIVHLQLGNTFEVPGHSFFVEDACSGVHSFLALLAISALWSVYGRLPLLAAVGSLVFAAATAVVLNIARVLVIVYTAAAWNWELSTGLAHEMLGLGLFLIGLLLLGSMNQLGRFFFTPLPLRLMTSSPPPPPAPYVPVLADVTRPWLKPCAAFALLLWVPQGWHLAQPLWQARAASAVVSHDFVDRGLAFHEETLPETLHGWKRVEFKPIQRSLGNLEGHYSRQWAYAAPFGTVFVSMDFPFTGWHPLERCYLATGWTVADHAPLSATSPELPSGETIGALGLRRQIDVGYVLHSTRTDDGAWLPFPVRAAHPSRETTFTGRLWARLRGHRPEASTARVPTTIQIQMLVAGEVPLSDADRQEITRAFTEVREQLAQKLQASP